MKIRCLSAVLSVLCALSVQCLQPVQAGEIKVLICSGDYGMWAQERVPFIRAAVEKAAPGLASFTSDQSFNFVEKLEAPGFASKFDVIVIGDLALGQITPEAQAEIVKFVNDGGGLIYVIWSKSNCPWNGSLEAVPMPLISILPYKYPELKPSEGATAFGVDAPMFKGLDFSTTPLMKDKKPATPDRTLLFERAQGKGKSMALLGAFGTSYDYISYATFKKGVGGWDEWPGFGELWVRLLRHASEKSPVLGKSLAEVMGSVKDSPLDIAVSVDATRSIDDVRSANFSIVALQQLYNEDGGAGEELFLDLNPKGWMDRRTQEVLPNTKGKFPDKAAFMRQYGMDGIIMANNSYGSYGKWDAKTWEDEVQKAANDAKKYPDILHYFQPGNEPPLDKGYFEFHNKIASLVLKDAPELKVIGPNKAFNIEGVDVNGMKSFIDSCGANTDVLNWHIYAEPPSMVLREVSFWTDYAKGKLRDKGPAHVMFTEADCWNNGDSQFNYLMQRAFSFIPEKRIIATFQYCMRPRSEGGTYSFGVLQPKGDFSANYNGYLIWRDLRGKLVDVSLSGASPQALRHCHVLASSDGDGKIINAIAYYDTGYFDGASGQKATSAKISLKVKLPPGKYSATRSDVTWNLCKKTDIFGVVEGSGSAEAVLSPCQSVSFTWTRQ